MAHPPRDAIAFQQEWDAGDLGCGEPVIDLPFKLKAIAQAAAVLRERHFAAVD